MPIEIGFWEVNGDNIKKIDFSSIDNEKRLEDIIYKDISIIDDNLLTIGRQVHTSYGKIIDLLTIDESGNLTIIELKKNKTSREVVAQTLDYASWVQNLSYQDVKNIFEDKNETSFEEAYEDKFGSPPPEKINQEHDMIIVCSELDLETERILNYLSDNYNIPINVVFFRFFKEKNSEYISRTWLIAPDEVEEKSSKLKSQNKSEPWNGKDFVVNIDVGKDGKATWEDSVKYGFIAAGGGKWYSRTLSILQPGKRIFAMIPKKGYVGVGIVKEQSLPAKEFKVNYKEKNTSILDVPLKCEFLKDNSDDLDLCYYFVKIEWIRNKNMEDAYWVKGLRANQNSAFKLRNKFTLDKLTEHFELDD